MGLHEIKRRAADALVNGLDAGRWARRTGRFAEAFEARRLREFLAGLEPEKLDVRAYPVAYIEAGSWRFDGFNMFFCLDVLANVAHCLSKRQLPYVELRDGAGRNIWAQFLEQPFHAARPDATGETGGPTCACVHAPVYFPQFPTAEDVRVLSKLYRAPIFELNAATRAYVEREYEEIFVARGRPRICGVLCRGTDYKYARYHQKQPPVEDVIALVRRKMDELDLAYIYLATEEYRIQRMFDEAFPGKVLINKRVYYDAYWELAKKLGADARIGMVRNDRENDRYLSALEYLSSLQLLARCDALIAGACGGSCATLYMNGGKYEYWHLFNLGRNE